jgi:hypothetical protein
MKRQLILPNKVMNKTQLVMVTPSGFPPAIIESNQWVENSSQRVATITSVSNLKVELTFNPHCLLAKRVHALHEFRNLYTKA